MKYEYLSSLYYVIILDDILKIIKGIFKKKKPLSFTFTGQLIATNFDFMLKLTNYPNENF